MPPNRIIEKMRQGEKALGLALSFYSDDMIELAGLMGLDFVNYDGQHAPVTPETIDRFCRMCDGFGLTPTMRVPDQIPSNILNYLDRGIMAVTVPNLETKEQAEDLVRACFFSPIGMRSYTGQRIVRYGIGGDPKRVMADTNANFLLMPQLESITAYSSRAGPESWPWRRAGTLRRRLAWPSVGPNLAHSIVRVTIVVRDTATTWALSSHKTPSLGRFRSAMVAATAPTAPIQ